MILHENLESFDVAFDTEQHCNLFNPMMRILSLFDTMSSIQGESFHKIMIMMHFIFISWLHDRHSEVRCVVNILRSDNFAMQ